MIKFIAAKELEGSEVSLNRPTNTQASGELLGTLTMLVLNRFMEQVDWDAITEIYVSGLVDGDDLALVKRAVKTLGTGGVEFV